MHFFKSFKAVISVCLGLLVICAFPAGSGKLNRQTLEAQLGARLQMDLPLRINPGFTADAIVVDPGKLGALGLNGLNRGDKLRLIKEGNGSDFTVEVTHRLGFTVNPDGSLRKLAR